jgi:nucleoside-diphosphate-sugar epimerase
MTPERSVLFVGGTGTISASCVDTAVSAGMQVNVLNRGLTSAVRPVPDGVTFIEADVSDAAATRAALAGKHFDSIVNFTVFTAKQAQAAIELLAASTDQYIHISTAAMYRKPVVSWPIVESTPRYNPFCAYAREKIEAEDVFTDAYVNDDFPVTIVRPSHTYDDAQPPLPGGWTIVDRIVRGKQVIVPGDGTSLWTVTHALDFAVGLIGLMKNPASVGETFHITSDFVYTWDQIYHLIADALGVDLRLAHVPSELIALSAPTWLWTELILGDLSHSAVFDNTKIKRFVPEFAPRITFPSGVLRFISWRDRHPEHVQSDPEIDAIYDRLARAYEQSRSIFAASLPPV